MSGRKQRGSAIIEMTLVGIPLIFTLISTFEISRGMWVYHTLAYSVKEGVRFGVVHGVNCINNPPGVPNNCPKTIADVAKVIQGASVGLDPQKTLLTFTAGPVIIPCYMGGSGSNLPGPFGTNDGCASTTTIWPPCDASATGCTAPSASAENATGQQIRIDIKTPFKSAIAMLWPGSHQVSFAEADLGASSTDSIQF